MIVAEVLLGIKAVLSVDTLLYNVKSMNEVKFLLLKEEN